MYTLEKRKISAVSRHADGLPWPANAPEQDLVVPPTNVFQACSAEQNTPWRYSHDPWLLVRRCKQRKPKNWLGLKGEEYIRKTNCILRRHEEPLARFMTAQCPSLISVKHFIQSNPPLAILQQDPDRQEDCHRGVLIQPSARIPVADWWTVRCRPML